MREPAMNIGARVTCGACGREAPKGKFVEFGSWAELMATGRNWRTTWVCDDECAGVLSETEGRPVRESEQREDLDALIEMTAGDRPKCRD